MQVGSSTQSPLPPHFEKASLSSTEQKATEASQTTLHGRIKVFVQQVDYYIAQESRRFWQFVTSSVPTLIKALSVFFESFICREKIGPTYSFRFIAKEAALEKNLSAFHKFNEAGPGILKKAESLKGLQILTALVNECEIAKAAGNHAEVKSIQEKMKRICTLLEKDKDKKLSRNHLSAEEWSTLDTISYELTSDFFANLSKTFNAAWFKSLCFDSNIEQAFHTNYQEALIAENLALALAYIEGIDGKSLAIPVFDEETQVYKSVNYLIHETKIGDNLPCYILESEEALARPWVIVRGTQYYTDLSANGKELRKGSLESILADSIDHKCIARHVINKTLLTRSQNERESLGSFFEKWHRENKSANLTGHSLGATLVNNLAVEFYDTVHKAYAFSGAGVSKKIAKRWNFLIDKTRVRQRLPVEARELLHAKLVNFDYEGDLIPTGGSRLIGLHLAIKNLAKREMAKMYYCHVSCHLNNNFAITKVDVVKEKKKLARWFCEELRIITGRCFRFLLTALNRKQFPDWWLNRKVYKEAAYHHRIEVKETRRRQYENTLMFMRI